MSRHLIFLTEQLSFLVAGTSAHQDGLHLLERITQILHQLSVGTEEFSLPVYSCIVWAKGFYFMEK